MTLSVWSSTFFGGGKNPTFQRCSVSPYYSSQGWRATKPLCCDPVSRPCCLPRRLICAPGCRWCRRLLNVSFGPSAWFSLLLFLFIYFVYQFVTQMNNGWGRLLPRRQAKLIIVMRLLAKTRSTALPRLPLTLLHFWMTDELIHWHIPLPPWLSFGCCAQADKDKEELPQEKDM